MGKSWMACSLRNQDPGYQAVICICKLKSKLSRGLFYLRGYATAKNPVKSYDDAVVLGDLADQGFFWARQGGSQTRGGSDPLKMDGTVLALSNFRWLLLVVVWTMANQERVCWTTSSSRNMADKRNRGSSVLGGPRTFEIPVPKREPCSSVEIPVLVPNRTSVPQTAMIRNVTNIHSWNKKAH